MNTWQQDVLDFHKKFDCKVGDFPSDSFADADIMDLRFNLIQEEFDELAAAHDLEDFPEFIDAIADSIYVLLGTCVSLGVDLEPIWKEVHKTNMAKAPGNSRKDGKILKPEDWTPPDIKPLLKKQGWEETNK